MVRIALVGHQSILDSCNVLVIFPAMVDALFTTDIVYGGLLSCAIGAGTCLGQFTGCLVATPGGLINYKLMLSAAMMCAFIGGIAGAGESKSIATALAVMGSFSVGLLESIGNGMVTIILDDQTEMGAAVGVYGSIRSAGGVLASASLILHVARSEVLIVNT